MAARERGFLESLVLRDSRGEGPVKGHSVVDSGQFRLARVPAGPSSGYFYGFPEAVSGLETPAAITGTSPSDEKWNGSNYHVWKVKVKVKMLLQERGLWEIVTGEECPPKNVGEESLKYQKEEQSAFNLICSNVKDKLLIQCSRAKTSNNAWKALEDT
ncbi:hypothetical protein K493DRAFT_351552 [Basidiobolus meristosporus CBS 931.73]|uniref:Uncharacterized protein n=1 Tax=Basidiobolus meristosporus CBS 931.73 TaxID=1314790 RepID=A0A1Y1YCX2_9FUNG|nr:hypothetical protein K493DRAFT_351552 [Basidiobolus meristosporus CBS 931.73]|eukprot:ORX95464.1 hypothetical protein K493DRAFT_351552 [Basidiobolus meristosporus CBS 931.73]